jgi:hypothetical protein
MLTKYPGYLKLALHLIVSIVLQQAAMAQSTIFNIPTTDTVSPKKGYFEFDYLPQIPKTEGSRSRPMATAIGYHPRAQSQRWQRRCRFRLGSRIFRTEAF